MLEPLVSRGYGQAMNTFTLSVAVGLTIMVMGCNENTTPATPASSAAQTAKAPAAAAPPSASAAAGAAMPASTGTLAAPAGDASTPKGSIAHQLQLLEAGNVDELKHFFTERHKDKITADLVAKGKESLAKEKMTLDELFASSEEGEADGKKTAKIKMKNGRTLTTLVLTDGKWLSDTIWFK